MASQYEPPSVWGSALTMRLQVFATECGRGSRGQDAEEGVYVTQRTQYKHGDHLPFTNRSWRCAKYLRRLNCHIPGTAGTWSPRVMACRISVQYWYCHSRDGTYATPKRPCREWDQSLIRSSRWCICRVLYVVPCASDLCGILQCPIAHNGILFVIRV